MVIIIIISTIIITADCTPYAGVPAAGQCEVQSCKRPLPGGLSRQCDQSRQTRDRWPLGLAEFANR